MITDTLAFATKLVQDLGPSLKKEFTHGPRYELLPQGEHEIVIEKELDHHARQAIAKAFPDDEIASVDTPIPSLDKAMWTIDVIDGGVNFAKQIPFFCSAISLIKNMEVLLAVAYDPIHDELFVAEKGRGTHLNNKKLTIDSNKPLHDALVSVTNIEHHPLSFANILKPLVKSTWATSLQPSSILSACYVAANRYDAHLFNGRRIWDIAPATLIIEEAGGTVTDFAGNPWDMLEKFEGVVYAEEHLHDEIVTLMHD